LKARATETQRKTRIQMENEERILDAALEEFSVHGFRGATIDRIAEHAGMSKPNLLYYFRRKQDIYESLIARLLVKWLEPLQELDAVGDPLPELQSYIRRKLEMARDFPRESRLLPTRSCRVRRGSSGFSRASSSRWSMRRQRCSRAG
jgi:TetR/AcrR family transcriptional regulator